MHVGAVSVAEPLQIFLRTGRCDSAFKFFVHCGIAVKMIVEVALDVQQHLPEEAEPLLLNCWD
ncbi:hypothetical protein F7725_017399 [Dissostichus mawsoni]|uniref:Uncharacterized protein n=1 Tax=Dissostichus mawsoni TaxID=36200 RepID=A0A7J5Z4Z5_DISMA|nr:hypothetical protein F7725_017399 [Dissostichus mawsoni]